MLKKSFILLFIILSNLFPQIQNDFIFPSLPTGNELYISHRQLSIGQKLIGVTSDFYSDLFRNPAFINQIDTLEFLIDFSINKQLFHPPHYYASEELKKQIRSNQTDVTVLSNNLSTGLIAFKLPKFLWKFAIFAHGYNPNYQSEYIDNYNRKSAEYKLNSKLTFYKREIELKHYDIHLFNGVSSSNYKLAFDYTYSKTEEKNSDIYKENENKIAEVDYGKFQNYYYTHNSNKDSSITSHIFRFGIIREISKIWNIDIILTTEKSVILKKASFNKDESNYDELINNEFNSAISQNKYEDSINYPVIAITDDWRLGANLKNNAIDKTVISYLMGINYLEYYMDEKQENLSNKEESDSTLNLSSLTKENFSRTKILSSQSGYKMGSTLGIGFEYKENNFISGFALKFDGYFGKIEYPLEDRNSYSLTEYFSNQLFNSVKDSSVYSENIKLNVSVYKLTSPIGFEMIFAKKLFLRFGFNMEFHYQKIEKFNDTLEETSTNNNILTSYSFGLGYKHKKLELNLFTNDVLNVENWRISLSYKL